jgi:hypothetical protein
MKGIRAVREAIYQHPAMNEVDVENGAIVSVYEGVRISTGRRRPKNQKYGFGDLDPVNSKLNALLAGELDLAVLDNEEITYGIPRCDDGKFSAKAAWQAAHLPEKAKAAIRRELYTRASNKLHSGLLPAIDSIVEMATSPHVEDAVRLKAATYLFERLQGKTPEVVIHAQEAPWEVQLAGVRRGPRKVSSERALEDGNTQDAEIVEE